MVRYDVKHSLISSDVDILDVQKGDITGKKQNRIWNRKVCIQKDTLLLKVCNSKGSIDTL